VVKRRQPSTVPRRPSDAERRRRPVAGAAAAGRPGGMTARLSLNTGQVEVLSDVTRERRRQRGRHVRRSGLHACRYQHVVH